MIDEFLEKAGYSKDNEKSRAMAKVVQFMVDEEIIEVLTYQRFINLVYQLRKVVFI